MATRTPSGSSKEPKETRLSRRARPGEANRHRLAQAPDRSKVRAMVGQARPSD